MKIILGSSSPRRKVILENIFEKIEIMSPGIDETAQLNEAPRSFSERIAKEKSYSILSSLNCISDFIIISCDTIVNLDNRIIGKPMDFKDAVKKIKLLSGKTHQVISSISLIYSNGNNYNIVDSEITNVTFNKITDPEIINYLNKFDYMDKAGAYAVQESGYDIIQKIDGSITNVIGFPLRLFFRMLTSRKELYDLFFTGITNNTAVK